MHGMVSLGQMFELCKLFIFWVFLVNVYMYSCSYMTHFVTGNVMHYFNMPLVYSLD